MLTYTEREDMNKTLIRREYDIMNANQYSIGRLAIPNFRSNAINLVYNQVLGVIYEYSQVITVNHNIL